MSKVDDSTGAASAQEKQKRILQPSTAVANALIDNLFPLRTLSDKAKVALIVVVRLTDGWRHCESCMLSLPLWMALCGSTNKRTFEAAVQELLMAGIIKREERRGQRGTFYYSLNPRYSSGKSATAGYAQDDSVVAEVPPSGVAKVPPLPVAEVPPLNDSAVSEVPLVKPTSRQSTADVKASAKDSSLKTKEKTIKDSLSAQHSDAPPVERENKTLESEKELEEDHFSGRLPTEEEKRLLAHLRKAEEALSNSRGPHLIEKWEKEAAERRTEYVRCKNVAIRAYQQEQASYIKSNSALSDSLLQRAASPSPQQAAVALQSERAPIASERQTPLEAVIQAMEQPRDEDIDKATARFQRADDALSRIRSARLTKYAGHSKDWWEMEKRAAQAELDAAWVNTPEPARLRLVR